MSRLFFTLANADVRRRAKDAIDAAPEKARVQVTGPARSLDQNAKLWPMLNDVSEQVTYFGEKYTDEDWKIIFLAGLGQALRMAPSISGGGMVPLGRSSSKLSKSEFSDLIELIYAFGSEKGVVWSEPTTLTRAA